MSFLIRGSGLAVKGDVFIRERKGGRFKEEGVKRDKERELVGGRGGARDVLWMGKTFAFLSRPPDKWSAELSD